MNARKDYDAVVVGGGLIGLAVGYGLARRGLCTVILDEGDRALRAARGNFGLVWIQSKGATFRPYASLSRRSAALWPDFARELEEVSGIGVRLRWGGLHLCHGEEELTARAALMRQQFDTDLPVPGAYAMLDRKDLLGVLPQVGPEVVGASYGRLDGHVDPLRLLRALTVAYVRCGGAFRPDSAVSGIERVGSGYEVVAGGERLHGDKLVLAAGLGNARLAPLVGIGLPIFPLRGQVLVTERQAPWLTTATHVVRQMDEGTIVIGDSQEDAGYDDGTELGVLGNIAARAVRSFPLLARAQIVRAWSCLRIMTRDGIPIYQESTTCPGAYAFSVHSGVTLAAVHASVLAAAVADGALGAELAPFSGARFALPEARHRAA
jgi:glycine/D-amino acid oxidase-like deaminating enzyme